MFNFYEETIRVPLIISNPDLFPARLTSDALVSHVDFVPTMAALLGAPPGVAKAAGWQGVDYSTIVADPANAPPAQDYITFLFDDFQYGQAGYPGFPTQHVRSIVEERWKVRVGVGWPPAGPPGRRPAKKGAPPGGAPGGGGPRRGGSRRGVSHGGWGWGGAPPLCPRARPLFSALSFISFLLPASTRNTSTRPASCAPNMKCTTWWPTRPR